MKRRVFGMIALILLIGVVGACWYVLNEIFPKAPPIRMPQIEEISSISVAVNHDDTFEIEGVDLEELFAHIGNAEPTREQSVNDYPSPAFFRIEVETQEMEYRYFVYERGEQVYIEIPYEGIYTADSWVFSFVIKYFEE